MPHRGHGVDGKLYPHRQPVLTLTDPLSGTLKGLCQKRGNAAGFLPQVSPLEARPQSGFWGESGTMTPGPNTMAIRLRATIASGITAKPQSNPSHEYWKLCTESDPDRGTAVTPSPAQISGYPYAKIGINRLFLRRRTAQDSRYVRGRSNSSAGRSDFDTRECRRNSNAYY
jgi:hypothetical protein